MKTDIRESNRLARFVLSETIAEAWLLAAEYLLKNGREAFGLIVEVRSPLEELPGDRAISDLVDEHLRKARRESVDTVASTIFPAEFYSDGDAKELYEQYDDCWSLIRQLHHGNSSGTYFRRLSNLETIDRDGNLIVVNQLDHMIGKMRRQLSRRGGALRCAYPLTVFQPGLDSNVTMGFPCMTCIDVKIENGALRMTAQYRNQMYITRAMGNLIGLARLQAFVATEVSLDPGHLLCIATHAELDKGQRAVSQLLTSCRRELEAHGR